EESVAWEWAELLIEANSFALCTPPGNGFQRSFLSGPESVFGTNALSQYFATLSLYQHRLFAFMISIVGDNARLVRYDHAGAVVSASFNYVYHPELLAMFVYRYVNMSSEQRGFDPTATLASATDTRLFRRLADSYPAGSHLATTLKEAAAPRWPIYKLALTCPWSSDERPVRISSPVTTRHFLIGRPLKRSHGTGRKSRRAYVAWDENRKSVVLIKDYWRDDSPSCLTEFEVYVKMWEHPADEMFIPYLLGGGDVVHNGQSQRTLTETFIVDQHLNSRVHTRLVIKQVCRSLVTFENCRELVSVVHDALRAHERAWTEFGILHRDIGARSILIYDKDTGRGTRAIGLLCDWDLATIKEKARSEARSQYGRVGTWQSMSAALLNWPGKAHRLSDDLESAMHLLTWCALKYLPHEYTNQPFRLSKRIFDLYDIIQPDGLGSPLKLEYVIAVRPFVPGLPKNHPFKILLFRLGLLLRTHYHIAHPDAIDELYDQLDPNSPLPEVSPLLGHAAVLGVFEDALNFPVWLGLQKLVDQCQREFISSVNVPTDQPTSQIKAGCV
ncbi:hypothetical protein C8Q79DRAFT_900206, partial [Trametes meyenii]